MRTLFVAGTLLLAIVIAIFVFQIQEDGSLISSGDGIEIKITPIASPVDKVEYSGPFQGGCPPNGAMIFGDQSPQPSQKYDPALTDKLVRVERFDGTVVHKFETKAFCLFLDDGVVKGVLNYGYAGKDGPPADPFLEVLLWMSRQKIDANSACEIVWIWDDPCGSSNPTEPDKENPSGGDEDGDPDREEPGEQPEGDTGLA